MGDRGARPVLSRKRIHPAEFAPLQSVSPLLDPARYRSRARQGERHESPNHRQRGADPTRGTDQHDYRQQSGSPHHAASRQSRKFSLHSLAPLSGKTDCFAMQRCKVRTRNAPGVCDTYRKENDAMAKVVKVIELMSQSPKSWEDAAQGAVKEASKTLRNVRSIYIKEFTAEVGEGKVQITAST